MEVIHHHAMARIKNMRYSRFNILCARTLLIGLFAVMAFMTYHSSQSIAAQEGASSIIMPSPNLLPEDVVAIQLLGLQQTKGDSSSVEMRQVWAFAHPSNKAITGPLARFARLFDMPAYRPLLGHKSHDILRIAETETMVQMQVQVTGSDSQSYVYLWIVGKADTGQEAGSWMTLSVSAPAGGGTQS